jgi:hypothetical protein
MIARPPIFTRPPPSTAHSISVAACGYHAYAASECTGTNFLPRLSSGPRPHHRFSPSQCAPRDQLSAGTEGTLTICSLFRLNRAAAGAAFAYSVAMPACRRVADAGHMVPFYSRPGESGVNVKKFSELAQDSSRNTSAICVWSRCSDMARRCRR